MTEWQCPVCGEWIAAGWWRHSHVKITSASLDEMIAARKGGEFLDYTSEVTTYMRTGKEPKREAPDGQENTV